MRCHGSVILAGKHSAMETSQPSLAALHPSPVAGPAMHGPAGQPMTSVLPAPLRWLIAVGSIYLLLVAVALVGDGFSTATAGQARSLFEFASNPFVGLMVGLLATALLQSSSTVSAIVVGLVAGGLPVQVAVPIIMGANIGTTLTSTLVSLGHIGNREEFRRAFGAATVHDFFNLLAVLIFLPIEILFAPLQTGSAALAGLLGSGSSFSLPGFNPVKLAVAPLQEAAGSLANHLPDALKGMALVALGIAGIVLSITVLGRQLRHLLVGRARAILEAAIGRHPLTSIASGAGITVLVQSSSTTTALIVPLAGSGALSLRQVYPFTLGANIGTCVTALLAATAVSGLNANLALQIALVHLLFNVLGVAVIYSIPLLRELPLRGAEWLAELGSRRKVFAASWVVGVFLLLPGALIAATSLGG